MAFTVTLEVEVKTSATIALALATALSGSLAAYAQTELPTVHHHYRVHHHHHHDVAPNSAMTSDRAGVAIESAPPQPNPIFRPYAHPGDGDNDGLSRDPDDCMKGCIGGNPQ
jgi:hypothetical protein